ncbi:MAG TPA: hypothetical protein VFW29_05805 [Solirubrobacteraceae bacterium]|nr:hypothetical protein [Solirubrobacteraceae bacterium]
MEGFSRPTGGARTIDVTLLPGADALLLAHARELPQRDDLCGAFCGALALVAAGVRGREGREIDQDDVALAAGSLVSSEPQPEILPAGEHGRRDYRLDLPRIDDGARSGTTAQGVVAAIGSVSDGAAEAIPLAGPWTVGTLAGAFALVAALERPAALLANLHTRYLWGSHASLGELLGHLLEGADDGPPPDWEVGHFVCVVGRATGPAGALYALADTYRALGADGVHMQPAARLAAALERREDPAGGVIAVVLREDAEHVRAGARELGLREALWDNGTPAAERAA